MNKIINLLLFIFLLTTNVIYIVSQNYLTLITVLLYIAIFLLMNILFFRKIKLLYINIFLFFILSSNIIYYFQVTTIPDYFGFSGGVGFGTDDSYFYARAIDYYSTYMDLPFGYPLRINYLNLRTGFSFFAWILSRFAYIVGLYKKIEPLDLVYVNALTLSFLPIFTEKLSILLFKNKKIGDFSLLLTIFSPFIIANSLVLVRDGWTATIFIGMLFYYFKKQKSITVLFLIILSLIRLESGAQGIVVLSIIYFFEQRPTKKTIIFLLGSIAFLILLFIFKEKILALTGGSLTYRKNFVDTFIPKDRITYKIQQKNIFLRIPITMIIFYLSPIFAPNRSFMEGIFVIRWFLYYGLNPIINLFCIGYFTKMLFSLKKNKNLRLLFYPFLFLLYFVSQFSYQLRHSTMYFPLYYILCSYGMAERKNIKISSLKMLSVVLTVVLYIGVSLILK